MDLELRKAIQQFIYTDNFRKDEQKDFCNSFEDFLCILRSLSKFFFTINLRIISPNQLLYFIFSNGFKFLRYCQCRFSF